MLAARYLGPGRIEPVEVPIPSIEPGEALIEVEACGFCGSDLNIVAGTHPRARPPLTIGHELGGRIVDIRDGGNSAFRTGDRVTSYPLISCGKCLMCASGSPHVCRTLGVYGFDADGGMAEFVRLPLRNLVKVPSDLSPEVCALLEPLAVAVHGLSRTSMEDAGTVIVIGAGPIGLLTALAARARGVPNLFITDVLESRLKLAESLGLSPLKAGEEAKRSVDEATNGEGADVVFECAGAITSAAEMLPLVRCRGTIVNLGVFKKPVAVDMQSVNFSEITIVGSRVYAREDFDVAIDLAHTLPLDRLVTTTFPLTGVAGAFDRFQMHEGVCKVLIRPHGGTA